MTSVYESLLSEYPDKGVVGKPELQDSDEVIADKLRVLYDHFVEAKASKKPILVLIGAGVSTGSKLPDFRGKHGVWTLQAQGKQAEGVEFQKALPGVSHQAILALHKAGYIKTTITQNVDGLDRKVGIPVKDLIEVHGNLFLEVCETCKREYIRDDIVMSVGFNLTGRKCAGNPRTGRKCRGRLKDATLDWDSAISKSHLTRIQKAWKETSHLLCLGTSLEIIPMGSLPIDAKHRGIQTTTVNFQETAHEKKVANAIHADVKLVLYSLCAALKLEMNLEDVPDEVPTALKFLEDSEDVKATGDHRNLKIGAPTGSEDAKDTQEGPVSSHGASEDVKDPGEARHGNVGVSMDSEDVKAPEDVINLKIQAPMNSEDVKDPEKAQNRKQEDRMDSEDVGGSHEASEDGKVTGDHRNLESEAPMGSENVGSSHESSEVVKDPGEPKNRKQEDRMDSEDVKAPEDAMHLEFEAPEDVSAPRKRRNSEESARNRPEDVKIPKPEVQSDSEGVKAT